MQSDSMEQPPFLHSIPPEILRHICSFLNAEDLRSLMLVSKTIYNTAVDDLLWRDLCFRHYSSVSPQIVKILNAERKKGVQSNKSKTNEPSKRNKLNADKSKVLQIKKKSEAKSTNTKTKREKAEDLDESKNEESEEEKEEEDSSDTDLATDQDMPITWRFVYWNKTLMENIPFMLLKKKRPKHTVYISDPKTWHAFYARCIAVSPPSAEFPQTLFVGTSVEQQSGDPTALIEQQNNVISAYEIDDGAIKCILSRHDNHAKNITGLDCSEKYLVSCSSDRMVRVWSHSRSNWNQVSAHSRIDSRVLSGHTHAVRSVKINDELVYSCGNDGTLRIWDIDSCSSIQVFNEKGALSTDQYMAMKVGAVRPKKKDLTNLISFPSSSGLICCSQHRNLLLFDLAHGNVQFFKKLHDSPITALKNFGKSENVLVTGGLDCKLKLIDIRTGSVVRKMSKDSSYSKLSTISALWCDENRLICGTANGKVHFFDAGSGLCLSTLKLHGQLITDLQLLADNELDHHTYTLITASKDKTVKIFDISSEANISPPKPKDKSCIIS